MVILNYCRKHLPIVITGVLFLSTVLITGYKIRSGRLRTAADTLQLNAFVEPDFPFISTSIDARRLGPAFPQDNMPARTLALQLGDSAYACFDTDLLRWSVAWTGHFLPMVLMAQISYKDFFNKNNKIASLTGGARLATGSYPGWYSGPLSMPPASRSNEPNWGPLPEEKGRWKGLYVYNNQAVLNYLVGNTNVFELPGSAVFNGQIAFTRTLRVDKSSAPLHLIAADIANASGADNRGGVHFVYRGAGRDSVTAIGVLGKGGSWEAGVGGGRYLTVAFPASGKSSEATVALWSGPARLLPAFENFCKQKSMKFPDFQAGSPARWKQVVTTQGQISPDTAAFVTDQLTLPLANPWKRNVRVADISFFKDGRAAVVTFDGDVWTISGIDQKLRQLKWKRFASGLHEPMSVEVVQDTIYVFGREGIVRLNDLNADGEADFYENFSNVMLQSAESREWAADLVRHPDGSFYIAKGGSLDNGPGMTPKVAKGFRLGSAQDGSVLRITQNGRRAEVIATGLRGPYLGIHHETGTLTASDQQGNFVPSSPIYIIKKGQYYGVEPTAHRTDNPPVAPPLTWIPHNIDRSSLGQAWITGNKMGPLNGNLIHFSFGRPGLFRVLIDSSGSVLQGGVTVIPGNYPAPTSKGAMNPADGQLYVGGFNLWGSTSTGISALLRLRYTGKPSYLASQFQAGKQGIVLGFDSELDAESVMQAANFQVKRWDYKRTDEYGSGHFRLDGSTGEETMAVSASYLSTDRKKVFLLLPGMTPVMQMEVSYRIKARDGKAIQDQFWLTANQVSEMDLAQLGFANVNLALLHAKPSPVQASEEKSAPVTIAAGKDLFQKMACAGCHSEGLRTDGMYGPPFQNLYASRRVFEDGSTAKADEGYIRESILNPAKKVVKGYNPEMPSFEGVLSDNEIASIALYIKSLSGK